MYSLSVILRNKTTVASILLITLFAGSNTAIASTSKSIPFAILYKVDPSKPASKFEIITAVKKKFSGRILSVRKRYKARGNDCHHVKFIDRKGELFLIHVGCKKK